MTASVCYVVNIGYKLKNVVNGHNCVNIRAVSVNKKRCKEQLHWGFGCIRTAYSRESRREANGHKRLTKSQLSLAYTKAQKVT